MDVVNENDEVPVWMCSDYHEWCAELADSDPPDPPSKVMRRTELRFMRRHRIGPFADLRGHVWQSLSDAEKAFLDFVAKALVADWMTAHAFRLGSNRV
jgi:hypothetical protein